MKFLIAYDIADPRRLRHVAHRLERFAERSQKSVFVFEGTGDELRQVLRSLVALIDVHEDRIQAWAVAETGVFRRWDAGTALPTHVLCLIASPQETLLLEGDGR